MKKIIVKREVLSPKKENPVFKPTLKLSNVLNYLNGILKYETAKSMNDGSPVKRPEDPDRLACMLPKTLDAEKRDREEAESKGITYWIERTEYIRRHLALKTRQFKESEKIAIELSNQIDEVRHEQEGLKEEHKKSLLFATKRMNKFIKANESLRSDITSLKRQIVVLERKNRSLENVNERMMSNYNKELGELKKSLIEKDYEIERLKLAAKEATQSSQNQEIEAHKNGKRHQIYLDGYPIELDLSSDSSVEDNEREQSDNDESESEFVDVPSACSEAPNEQDSGVQSIQADQPGQNQHVQEPAESATDLGGL